MLCFSNIEVTFYFSHRIPLFILILCLVKLSFSVLHYFGLMRICEYVKMNYFCSDTKKLSIYVIIADFFSYFALFYSWTCIKNMKRNEILLWLHFVWSLLRIQFSIVFGPNHYLYSVWLRFIFYFVLFGFDENL